MPPFQRPKITLPAGIAERLERPADDAPSTRADIRTAERTLQAGLGMKRVDERSGADAPLIKAATAAELAGPLALAAMRRLEQGIRDPNPHVSFEAARVAATVCPKVTELSGREAADEDPAAVRATVLAALADPELCALLVEVVRSSEAPARLALERAGWVAPAD